MTAPIRISCEGSGCPPTGVSMFGDRSLIGYGICAMCGSYRALVIGRIEQHDRDDVLAMLDRGDFG